MQGGLGLTKEKKGKEERKEKWRKDSRRFQKILEDSRRFQNIPEDSRMFQKIPGVVIISLSIELQVPVELPELGQDLPPELRI